VLHLLRQTLGERLFWAGLRDYTRSHDGAPVTSREFQQSMERSTRKDLSEFFNAWIYLD
jgi:aminopeptidase N